MAKGSFLLGLIASLLTLLSCAAAVEITDIFTVQARADRGGCSTRADVLDQWLSEGIESIDQALLAIDDYNNDIEIRRAMFEFFGVVNRKNPSAAQQAKIQQVREYIQQVGNFLNEVQTNGASMYGRDGYWLFCDSTFLSLRAPTSTASDAQGRDILDQNQNPVRIMDIAKYRDQIAADPGNQPWWSDDVNGYYFTDTGANYCSGDNLGLTAAIQPLISVNGQVQNGPEIASVIICPYSFDRSPRPASYRDANTQLVSGTNLADAVPRSSTLLHELFHAIWGDTFLSAGAEIYDIAACMNLVRSNENQARVNPENYVFFIAQMFHTFGTDQGNEPWSIPTRWSFGFSGDGGNRIYGATQPRT
ncbi:hypothetical protein PVAG01_02053 [Phlyctema vagabunda]|uniref:Lysine-specific metallo-endopeptidase domain-containing protein n=1 Tax=Phlyctema vagabunda TaxID=108571 RepID=A0ABR4PPI4_9HELO